MTEAGRARRAELDAAGNRSESEVAELALLSLMEIEGRPVRADRLHKLPGGEAAAERLQRRKQLEAREVAVRRQARMQKIVAWNVAHSGQLPANDAGASLPEKKRASSTYWRRSAARCRCLNFPNLPGFLGRSSNA
jgi:hypothetical protein